MPLDLERQEQLRALADTGVRDKLKQTINELKREYVRRNYGARLSNKPRIKRVRYKYKKPCVRGCGNDAWHPPYGTGRCISCGVKESIPNRKTRAKNRT